MSQNLITTGKLAEVLGNLTNGGSNIHVSDITHDSRQVDNGTLFVAIKGATSDGHRFIDDVMRRGAVGIMSEQDAPEGFDSAWIKVSDARHSMAVAASLIHGEPSHRLDLIGVTGTNGKTTTTYLCFAIADEADLSPAMLTTVEYRIGNESEPAIRTTPEATDTNRFLARAADAGSKAAVMEASSQAIDLHRVDGLRFSSAIFTNLTRDHLDYHLTMEKYFDAKKKLFDGSLGEKPLSAAINIDDEWGRKLADELKDSDVKVTTFAIDRDADLRGTNINVSMVKGTQFDLVHNGSVTKIASPLVGRPHVYNMLSAAAAAFELGISGQTIAAALAKCTGAPGRFERVPHEGDFAVIVDYAHTDDALLNTLETARSLADGRIITVFGCGGDRDKTKRIPMGEIAGRLSDLTIITSDNPRNEDPMAIIAEVEKGVRSETGNYIVTSDRREAIFNAVKMVKPGDVVVIAGKGHENYQMIGNDKFHFDDREVAAEAIAARSLDD